MSLKLPGEAKKKKQKEYVFKPYAKNQSKRKYSKNRQGIHDIAKKAREKDMSYGEYVARFGYGQ